MKRGWIGLIAIGVLAAGVLAAKSFNAPEPPSGSVLAAPAPAPAPSAAVQVLLFADPREADSSCGCGQVFRAVRAAASRGVAVREIDPQQASDLVRQHRVTVDPTLLVFDAQGNELGRHEGESSTVLAAIREELERAPGSQG